MKQLTTFLQPGTLEEALALLSEHGDQARPLAGGTALVFSKSSRTSVLVDLRAAGLDWLEQRDDGLHLGAMTSLNTLRRHLEPGGPSALLEAAATAGSRILQNHITVGGNCIQVYAWSDLPVALLCLGAGFVLQGPQQRTVDAATLLAQPPLKLLGKGELLVEVVVPTPVEGSGSAYLKHIRTDTDHSLASAAAQVTLADGKVTAASIAVGAVRGLPQLLAGAADSLEDKAPEGAALAEAGRLAAQEAKVMADYRATTDYRKQLLGVMVEDALTAAVERAGGAS